MKSTRRKKKLEDIVIKPKDIQLATTNQLEQELERESYKVKFKGTLHSTIRIMIVVCAISVLIATFACPVLKIYGTSMTPVLEQGQYALTIKSDQPKAGDVLGVYYGSKILVKRCIALSGQWVNIDEKGNVYVDDKLLEEPYLIQKSLGECDIELPYQVPENSIFVMGDQREFSVDSRMASVGCISVDDIVGKIIFKIWPLDHMGFVK